jgi:hypothetical protein
MSQLLDPTFTVVLPSNVVLRDHEPALSREIHIPVFGPRDVEIVVSCRPRYARRAFKPSGFFQDPADSQTPIGFIVYKTEYAVSFVDIIVFVLSSLLFFSSVTRTHRQFGYVLLQHAGCATLIHALVSVV